MDLMNIEITEKLKNVNFFQILKNITSPAYEFLLHKCRNKNEKMIFFFKSEKKLQIHLNEFPLHRIE